MYVYFLYTHSFRVSLCAVGRQSDQISALKVDCVKDSEQALPKYTFTASMTKYSVFFLLLNDQISTNS